MAPTREFEDKIRAVLPAALLRNERRVRTLQKLLTALWSAVAGHPQRVPGLAYAEARAHHTIAQDIHTKVEQLRQLLAKRQERIHEAVTRGYLTTLGRASLSDLANASVCWLAWVGTPAMLRRMRTKLTSGRTERELRRLPFVGVRSRGHAAAKHRRCMLVGFSRVMSAISSPCQAFR
jgi:hypothetical protein